MGNEGINRAKYTVTAVLAGVFLCACSKEEAVDTMPSPPATQSVPVIEEVRETTRIITDPVGYDTGEEMTVYVLSEKEESTFTLINDEAKDTLFVGELKPTGKEIDGMRLYSGDMTSFSGEGTFKICTHDVREGVSISVRENILDERYQSLVERLEKIETDSQAKDCYRLAVFMLAGDVYDEESVDWAYVKKSIKDKLKEEQLILETDEGINEKNVSERLLACAILADFYSVYGDIEPDEVSECLEAAVSIYDRCLPFSESADKVALYFADASLNRATGRSGYRKGAEHFEHTGDRGEYADFEFIADMIYLRSRNVSDFDRCAEMVKDIVNDADKVAQKTDRYGFNVVSDIDEAGIDTTLDGLINCCMADYILSENAYEQIRRDHIHYLYGRNPQMKDMIEETDDINTLSKLIFVMK
ncbi:MAG: glycoside hydrolase family 9 protein [Lachnospiraceae bacterium]|nr:glycoside hydrolase family 9 protein [Lachnospiraceae bacterium]